MFSAILNQVFFNSLWSSIGDALWAAIQTVFGLFGGTGV